MSEYGTVEIKGLREFDNNLKQLPLKIQKKVLGQAARAGATVIRKEARKNIKSLPEKTGNLRKSITEGVNPITPSLQLGLLERDGTDILLNMDFVLQGLKRRD